MSAGFFRAFQTCLTEADGAFEEMNMAIHEARKDQLSAGVDSLCGWPTKLFDFGVISHGDDFVAANRYRLGPGLLGVRGVDLAVDEDGVNRLKVRVLRILCEDRRRDSKGEGNGERQDDHGFARCDDHKSPVRSHQSLPFKMSAEYSPTTARSRNGRDFSIDAASNFRNRGCLQV
jgi:hypothetical protein